MLYRIRVSTPNTDTKITLDRIKLDYDLSKKDTFKEEEFYTDVPRIPCVGEKLSVSFEKDGQSFFYTYQVLEVKINCYMKSKERTEGISTDASVTAVLLHKFNREQFKIPNVEIPEVDFMKIEVSE